MSKLRLAIIGAGPAGIYAADLILKAERDFEVSIDLFDHLPAPYGLVRYGVAPDHPRIKGIINALHEVLDRGDIRFFWKCPLRPRHRSRRSKKALQRGHICNRRHQGCAR